jgi:hypothetical protein
MKEDFGLGRKQVLWFEFPLSSLLLGQIIIKDDLQMS